MGGMKRLLEKLEDNEFRMPCDERYIELQGRRAPELDDEIRLSYGSSLYGSKPDRASTHSTFTKHDNKKPDLSLCEPAMLEAYAEASADGEKKYGRGNYKNSSLEDTKRYWAAFLRHSMGYSEVLQDGSRVLHGFRNGEECSPDSKVRNLSAALWCLTKVIEDVNNFGFEAVSKSIRGD